LITERRQNHQTFSRESSGEWMICVQEVSLGIDPHQAVALAQKLALQYATGRYRWLAAEFESEILLAVVETLNAEKQVTEKLVRVIAKRRVVSVKRREFARKQTPLRGVGSKDKLARLPDRTTRSDSPSESVERLECLEESDRDVVERHVFGEQSFREIAGGRGETQSMVHRRYRTSIGKLRRLMAND